MENKQKKCIKGKSCLYCGTTYCQFVDELNELNSFKEQIKFQNNFIDSLLKATNNSEWLGKSILDDETSEIIEKIKLDYSELDQLKTELKSAKELRKYTYDCCKQAGEELAKNSFEWDGKEKNLVVQAMELNERYDQLKEQLEAYKMEVEEGKKINAQLKAELTRANCQIADDEILQCDMREAIEELKAENEELKKTVDDLLHKPEIQDKILWKIDNEALLGSKDAYIYKLEKTLAEIKEIAEDNFYYLDCDYRWILEKILQKISEVLDENDTTPKEH